MMWADRAGVGSAALATLGVALLFFSGQFDDQEPWLKDPIARPASVQSAAPNVFDQFDAPKNAAAQRLLSDEEVGITLPRSSMQIALRTLILALGFGVAPAWMVARIIDFVFAGPTRRKRKSA